MIELLKTIITTVWLQKVIIGLLPQVKPGLRLLTEHKTGSWLLKKVIVDYINQRVESLFEQLYRNQQVCDIVVSKLREGGETFEWSESKVQRSYILPESKIHDDLGCLANVLHTIAGSRTVLVATQNTSCRQTLIWIYSRSCLYQCFCCHKYLVQQNLHCL